MGNEIPKGHAEVFAIKHYDEIFKTVILYFHGPYWAYGVVGRKLFAKPEKDISNGDVLCSFGKGIAKINGDVCIVWVDCKRVKLEDTLPCFLHGAVLASQCILGNAGIKDSSGELQAHFVEREFEIMLNEMFKKKLPGTAIMEAVDSILGEDRKGKTNPESETVFRGYFR